MQQTHFISYKSRSLSDLEKIAYHLKKRGKKIIAVICRRCNGA